MPRSFVYIQMADSNESMFERVRKARVIAIVRGFTGETCLRLAEAYLKGGITMMELPLEQRDPGGWKAVATAIASIRARFGADMAVGAGTVLDGRQLAVAAEAGADFVKIVPAGFLGPGYIKAMAAPLSHIPFLAFGGVDATNVKDYLAAGCIGVGVGGALTDRGLVERGDFAALAGRAAELNLNASVAQVVERD